MTFVKGGFDDEKFTNKANKKKRKRNDGGGVDLATKKFRERRMRCD